MTSVQMFLTEETKLVLFQTFGKHSELKLLIPHMWDQWIYFDKDEKPRVCSSKDERTMVFDLLRMKGQGSDFLRMKGQGSLIRG